MFFIKVTGSCLPVFGKKSGENCYQDADCETGYVCVDDTCSEPAPGVGKFGEECRESSDCNIHQGLCCRLTRRPRMQPKKVLGTIQILRASNGYLTFFSCAPTSLMLTSA